jgi:hypothetical protein
MTWEQRFSVLVELDGDASWRHRAAGDRTMQ